MAPCCVEGTDGRRVWVIPKAQGYSTLQTGHPRDDTPIGKGHHAWTLALARYYPERQPRVPYGMPTSEFPLVAFTVLLMSIEHDIP